MENKEIIEGNKLIAEFMGLKNLKDENGDLWDFQNTNEKIYSVRTNLLIYHTSWDWLIPVVEKIRKVSPIITRGWKVLDSIDNFNIIVTFKHAVEFIKWYNENKQV